MGILWLETDKGFNELKKTFKAIKERKAYVKVGVTGADAQARAPGEKASQVDIALINEFGAPAANIPARPAIRGTFEANKGEYIAMLGKGLKKVYENSATISQVLGAVGAKMASDIKQRIADGAEFVPNAPSTVQKKGSDVPLVDTGRYRQSITWDVVLDPEHGGEE